MSSVKGDRAKIDALVSKGMHPVEAAKEIKTVEIMPDVRVDKDSVSWFIGRMFNPEDNLWVWIRRIANIMTIPMFIFVIILMFK